MALFKKQTGPTPFNLPPIYWDPEKEEREEREARIKKELGIEASSDTEKTYRPNIKGQFRSATSGNNDGLIQAQKRAIRRLMIVVALLAVVAYFVFFYMDGVIDLISTING